MACHLEHVMPDDILQRVVAFSDYINDCPRGRVRWDEDGVREDARFSGEDCRRCSDADGEASCPALHGLKVAMPASGLADLSAAGVGQHCSILAFRDAGALHVRCGESGFTPGVSLRVLNQQEGITTLLNDAGQALALQAEELRQILITDLQ